MPDRSTPDRSAKIVPLKQPEQPERPGRQQLAHGVRRLREEDYAGAAEAFERALDDAPDEPEILLALGRERLRQERYEEANTLLARAVELQPDSAAAAALYARLLGLHLGRRQDAFAVIHRFLRRRPESAPLHVIRGELLLEKGELVAARAAFGRVLEREVADEAARTGLARTYNAEGIQLGERGDDEQAAFAFKRAAALDPRWSAPCVNLGVVFGRMGRLDKALAEYAAALERDPHNPVAYFNLAMTHQEQGRHDTAIRLFEELLDLCPDYPQVRASLANALGERGDFDRAIALLLEEIEIDDSSAGTWTSLGLSYVCAGNARRGEDCLRRALQADPRYFNAYYNLALLYVAEKRYDEAEQVLGRARMEHPERTQQVLGSDANFAELLREGRFFARRDRGV